MLARGEEKAGSDVDLLLIGTSGFADVVKVLYRAQQTLEGEINPVIYSPPELARRIPSSVSFSLNPNYS